MPASRPWPAPLIADGAMGTELQARWGSQAPPFTLNLLAPDVVRGLHAEYLAAGAQVLVANTLGAGPAEAEAGVRLALEAARAAPPNSTAGRAPAPGGLDLCTGAPVVLGSIAAVPPPAPAVIEALAPAQALVVETATSLGMVEAAVRAIRQVSRQPLWCSLSFAPDGRFDGLSPADAARALAGLGLAGFGYGCGFGPSAAAAVLPALRRAAPEAALWAKPNLGLPRNGAYHVRPVALARWALRAAALGVQVIGACCGSTPEHIRAVSKAIIGGADRLKDGRPKEEGAA